MVVRLGGVGPGRDDRLEGHRLCTGLSHGKLEPPRNRLLGVANLDSRRNDGEGVVGDLHRPREQRQLLRLLDGAQRVDELRGGNKADLLGGLVLLEGVDDGGVQGDGHVPALESRRA